MTVLWTSADIAKATHGAVEGGDFLTDGIAIDSRAVAPGNLFVALAGARDGHAYVEAARRAGATGALVSRPSPGPAVRVDDTLSALGDMAVAARRRAVRTRRAAITGSVGKTSVTQAVLSALKRAGDGHGPVKSFNNHIGVPLTLARMPATTERAVFEMGMNHAGEIAPLSRLVCPHVAAITSVEAVHVENFPDGVAGVARAKAEIFAGLEPGGVAVLNADSAHYGFLSEAALAAQATVRSFGVAEGADARLQGSAVGGAGTIVEATVDGQRVAYRLRQNGAHWGSMSLCALLVLQALGVERSAALLALASFEPLAGRGAVHSRVGPNGPFLLVDESYNASPVSVRAALTGLPRRSPNGRRLVALTDMLELGSEAAALHAELRRPIIASEIAKVYCAGPLMRSLWDGLPAAVRGAWAASAAELAPTVAEAVQAGDIIMVKGSNASKASLVVEALLAMSEAGE
jgi:UDP-N-acetylmuramoyl-tripeptide--D-alanyl-D-alanine ligase